MSPKITRLEIEPIGYVHTSRKYRFEAPRQGVYAPGEAVIRLNSGQEYEAGLAELDGFSHLWVQFAFHLNETWHPMVKPPVPGKVDEVGVFASRSPHRPSRLGLSCVELVRIDGLDLHIRNHDLLDLTPVLDIKPYVPYYDSFPEASTGWLPEPPELFKVVFKPEAVRSSSEIKESGGPDLLSFCQVQLGCEPLNAERKKIKPEGSVDNRYIAECRGHKIIWDVDMDKRIVTVLNVSPKSSS